MNTSPQFPQLPSLLSIFFMIAGLVAGAALFMAGASKPHLSHTDEGPMPDLDGAIGWLNSPPLNGKSLRGKVVLVDFWTYT